MLNVHTLRRSGEEFARREGDPSNKWVEPPESRNARVEAVYGQSEEQMALNFRFRASGREDEARLEAEERTARAAAARQRAEVRAARQEAARRRKYAAGVARRAASAQREAALRAADAKMARAAAVADADLVWSRGGGTDAGRRAEAAALREARVAEARAARCAAEVMHAAPGAAATGPDALRVLPPGRRTGAGAGAKGRSRRVRVVADAGSGPDAGGDALGGGFRVGRGVRVAVLPDFTAAGSATVAVPCGRGEGGRLVAVQRAPAVAAAGRGGGGGRGSGRGGGTAVQKQDRAVTAPSGLRSGVPALSLSTGALPYPGSEGGAEAPLQPPALPAAPASLAARAADRRSAVLGGLGAKGGDDALEHASGAAVLQTRPEGETYPGLGRYCAASHAFRPGPRPERWLSPHGFMRAASPYRARGVFRGGGVLDEARTVARFRDRATALAASPAGRDVAVLARTRTHRRGRNGGAGGGAGDATFLDPVGAPVPVRVRRQNADGDVAGAGAGAARTALLGDMSPFEDHAANRRLLRQPQFAEAPGSLFRARAPAAERQPPMRFGAAYLAREEERVNAAAEAARFLSAHPDGSGDTLGHTAAGWTRGLSVTQWTSPTRRFESTCRPRTTHFLDDDIVPRSRPATRGVW